MQFTQAFSDAFFNRWNSSSVRFEIFIRREKKVFHASWDQVQFLRPSLPSPPTINDNSKSLSDLLITSMHFTQAIWFEKKLNDQNRIQTDNCCKKYYHSYARAKRSIMSRLKRKRSWIYIRTLFLRRFDLINSHSKSFIYSVREYSWWTGKGRARLNQGLAHSSSDGNWPKINPSRRNLLMVRMRRILPHRSLVQYWGILVIGQ